jgi:hypothetical protein
MRDDCVAEWFEHVYINTVDWENQLYEILQNSNNENNSQVRRSLYRIFLIEQNWGVFRANVREELPECVVRMVRKRSPSTTRAYTGYHSGANSGIARIQACNLDGNFITGMFWVRIQGNWTLQDETRLQFGDEIRYPDIQIPLD